MKKKLTLDVTTLRIEPFVPSAAGSPIYGTVNGYEGMDLSGTSLCKPQFSDAQLCGPLTSYRCA